MPYPSNADISISFLLPQFFMRGRLVRLQDVNKVILNQHAYPASVAKVLAELLAVGTTLSTLLKYEGVFTFQTKTSGPLGLSVVDVTHEGHVRGYAQFNSKILKDKYSFKDLLGKGYLAFTVDQGLQIDRYQGIVELNQASLSEAIEHYFEQSEQLETRLFISSIRTSEGIWKSSVLLLQQMPSQTVQKDTWSHIEAILNTLTTNEFLDFSTPYEALLYRLFHEGGVTVFESLPFKAQCRCSKERIQSFLTSLTSDEIEGLLENGQLKMTCEFCNHNYEFDRKDLMTLH